MAVVFMAVSSVATTSTTASAVATLAATATTRRNSTRSAAGSSTRQFARDEEPEPKVFLDVWADSEPLGRIVIRLFSYTVKQCALQWYL